MTKKDNVKRYLSLSGVAIGHHMMFLVPYAASTFYMAFQNATGFTGTQIGMCITMLGIFCTIFYFPNGFITDRVSTKKLLFWGLFLSGILGLCLAALPGYGIMLVIYFGMAVTTVLLSYSASIGKSMRLLGTDEEQGKLYSVRTIVRNVVAIPISFIGAWLIAILPSERLAMQIILVTYSIFTIIGAFMFRIFFTPVVEDPAKEKSITFKDFMEVLKIRNIWLIGLFGFAVYLASISLIYIQPYMQQFYGLTTASTSVLGIVYKNIGLISAPLFVYLARKVKPKALTTVIYYSLFISLACFLFFFIVSASTGILFLAIIVFLIASCCIMASWSHMFVPIVEVNIPIRLTGSATGVVCLFAFLGDVFYYTVCGNLLDNYGDTGFKYIFILTIGVLAVAIIAAFIVMRYIKKKQQQDS